MVVATVLDNTAVVLQDRRLPSNTHSSTDLARETPPAAGDYLKIDQ